MASSLPGGKRARRVFGDFLLQEGAEKQRKGDPGAAEGKTARAAGHSASELIRKGLRVVASRYYSGCCPPSTRFFESTDNKLGDEAELFVIEAIAWARRRRGSGRAGAGGSREFVR